MIFKGCIALGGNDHPIKTNTNTNRHRWMNLKEIGVSIRNLIDSAQDRDYWRALVNAALNLQVQ